MSETVCDGSWVATHCSWHSVIRDWTVQGLGKAGRLSKATPPPLEVASVVQAGGLLIVKVSGDGLCRTSRLIDQHYKFTIIRRFTIS